MALIKQDLEMAILSAIKKAKNSGSDFEKVYAADLATAIHNYILKAEVVTGVNTNVNTAVGTTVATTGTSLAQAGKGTGKGTGSGTGVGYGKLV